MKITVGDPAPTHRFWDGTVVKAWPNFARLSFNWRGLQFWARLHNKGYYRSLVWLPIRYDQ